MSKLIKYNGLFKCWNELNYPLIDLWFVLTLIGKIMDAYLGMYIGLCCVKYVFIVLILVGNR